MRLRSTNSNRKMLRTTSRKCILSDLKGRGGALNLLSRNADVTAEAQAAILVYEATLKGKTTHQKAKQTDVTPPSPSH